VYDVAFRQGRLGEAAALGIVIAVLVAPVAYWQFRRKEK